MNILAVCIIVSAFLFFVVFITKRKFGLLGLALAAGSILSSLWVEKAGYTLGMLNVTASLLVISLISALIILLPAMLLIFHDVRYRTFFGRVVGAGLFTLLALAFLIDPIGRVLIPQGASAVIYSCLVVNNHTIIAVCLILAIIDLLIPKHKKSHEKHEGH